MASLNVGSDLRYQAATFGRSTLVASRARLSAHTVISENNPSNAGVVRRIARSDHCRCVSTPRWARTSWNEWATYCPSTLPFRSNDQIPISSTSRLMLSGDSLALCARGAVLRGATAEWVAFVLSGVDDGTGGGTDRNVAKATTDSCHSARPSSFGDAVSVLVGFHRLGGKSRCGGKN